MGRAQLELVARRPWELFGFGCCMAWMLSVVGGGSFFPEDAPASWTTEVRLGFAAGMAVGYVACYLARDSEALRRYSAPRMVAAGCVLLASTVLVCVPIEGAAAHAVVATSSLAGGLGFAYHMNAGGSYWDRGRDELPMVQLAMSFPAAFAMYFALVLIPHPVSVVVTALLPMLGGVILCASRGALTRGDGAGDAEDEPRGKAASPSEVPAAGATELRCDLFIVTLSLSFGCLYAMAAHDAGSPSRVSLSVFAVPAAVCAAMALTCMFARPTRYMATLFRLGGLLSSVGLFAVALCRGGGAVPSGPALGVLVAGYAMFDEYLWLLHSRLVIRRGLRSAGVVSRYEAMQWGCLAAGGVIGVLLGGTGAAGAALCACGVAMLSSFMGVFGTGEAARIVEVRDRLGSAPTVDERCELLAGRVGITPRELDVLRLLARGRSNSYIQEELGIAQGTVKAHARHIYEKAGVAGKQELIDLVERQEDNRGR